MGKKSKPAAATAETGEEFAECAPGSGGYQVAVYKNNNLKMLEPLGESSYKYVKSKFKKHEGGGGVQPAHKKIQKTPRKPRAKKQPKASESPSASPPPPSIATTSAPAAAAPKPKRVLSEKQRIALAKGREKRAIQLAELAKSVTNAAVY